MPSAAANMQTSLEDFFRVEEDANSKADIIRALSEHAQTLVAVRLAQPSTPISQARKDFRRERVLFNEVPFIPDKSDSHRNIAFGLSLAEYITRIRRCYPGCDNSKSEEKEKSEGINSSSDALSSSASTGANYDEAHMKAAAAAAAAAEVSSGSDIDGARSISNEDFLKLQDMSAHHLILQRACRTSAGADSFFMVQGLFATVPGTFVTQRTNILGFVPFVNGEPPVEIEVYVQEAAAAVVAAVKVLPSPRHSPPSSGDSNTKQKESPKTGGGGDTGEERGETEAKQELVAKIKVCNSFAIYDEDIIDLIAGEPETDPPPWLELETVITDEMNFKTGEQQRMLRLQVYCPETDTYYPPLNKSLSS